LESTRVRFPGPGAFHLELKRRVSAYFDGLKKSPRDALRMYAKTAVIMTATVGSYLLLLLAPVTWWQALLLGLCLALSVSGIGFSVQHDANHGGYSGKRWVNRLLGVSLDLIGASSYVWYWKHNIVHHTYTNISGIDVDVAIDPILRLAPDHPFRWYHRYQHIYIWFLYGLMTANWQFWADYRDLKNGHVGGNPFPRPSPWGWTGMISGKVFFYSWAIVIPLLLHPVWAVIGMFAFCSFFMGVVMTTTFQLAHCVDAADVVTVAPDAVTVAGATPMEVGWAEHQVRTTANFAPGNPLLTWYLGGLNYQVEHHLFPRICHVHYPALSRIVASTCGDFGIPYRSHRTLRGAVASHVRRLREFGRPEANPRPTFAA
jgi:linoleoyl-CoA desaturase